MAARTLLAAVIIVAIYALWFWRGDGRGFLDVFAHLRKRGWSWALAVIGVLLVSGVAALAAVMLTRVFGGPMQAW